jgi:hypothetical protein
MADDYREKEGRALRVLFCFGVTQSFFEAEPGSVPGIAAAITEAFADLGGRFGVRVLGTMDDDELQVGASVVWPWTAYVLADVPDLETVAKVTNVLREAEIEGARLWKYLRVEARVGRPLFFAND